MATLNTPTYGFPYPDGTERVADGDNAMGALALAIENHLLTPPIEGGGAPSYQSGWSNFGAPLGAVGWTKDANGYVHLKGAMKGGTIGGVAFSMPAGFRPADDTRFPVVSNNLFGVLTISSIGTVTPSSGSNVSFVLDGISYKGAG